MDGTFFWIQQVCDADACSTGGMHSYARKLFTIEDALYGYEMRKAADQGS
ncbi:hypothetical protein [Paenibacillus sp. y28]